MTTTTKITYKWIGLDDKPKGYGARRGAFIHNALFAIISGGRSSYTVFLLRDATNIHFATLSEAREFIADSVI